jgi:hypothetical protein
MNESTSKVILKIVTTAIIVVLFYFGVDLVKSDLSSKISIFTGAGLIFVGITLSVISFGDWRKREDYEHVIRQNLKVIDGLSSTINERSKTDRFQEKSNRSTFTKKDTAEMFGSEKNKYQVDSATETVSE